MRANVLWTIENDEILINFVRNHEALYNVKSKYYRKAQLKQNLWSNIGNILAKSGYHCCKRWAYVRDYYIRRRGKPGTGSGGEAAKKRSDLLSFLDSIPSSQRKSITNRVGDDLPKDERETTEDTRTDIEEYITQIDETDVMRDNKKNKELTHSKERMQLLEEIAQRKATPAQNEWDETDLFFNSMAKIVKKLPRYEQIKLRMHISSVVGDAELRSIANE